MNDRRFYVYVDIRLNRDIFYVGKGSGDRYKVFTRSCNKHWMAIVKKENGFGRRIVDLGLTETEAFDLERKLIKKHKKTVVNLTNGGEGVSGFKRIVSLATRLKISKISKGRKHTEEAKRKIGLAHIGKKHALGYKHTAEALKKIAQASKGKHYGLGYKHTEEAKRKISLASKGHKQIGFSPSPETRLKLSIAGKLRWSNKKKNEKTTNHMGI